VPTIYDAVDSILRAVEDSTPGSPGIPTRDRNDVILISAYGRAYRCLRTIRRIAGEGEADDAAALTRVLLSTALRSLYVVQPDAPEERQLRLAQLVHSSRRDQAAMLDEMHRLGFTNITEQDVVTARAIADETKWAGRLPGDQDLASMLDLAHFYSRVYRSTSDATHWGTQTMLAGFLEQPTTATGEGATISLDLPDEERASEALGLAALTYGAFLDLCDSVVKHGVTARVASILGSWQQDDLIARATP
jgi:hypothetical protein